VALSLTSSSRLQPHAGTIHLPPLPLVPQLLPSQFRYNGTSVAVLTCQSPLWWWTVLPFLLQSSMLTFHCPYQQWIRLSFTPVVWNFLTEFDQPEKTPLTFPGPLLLGHALKSMALYPLPILPYLPCPLASPWHVPHPIGGLGSHNAIRSMWGLPIGPSGPLPLSPFPTLVLN